MFLRFLQVARMPLLTLLALIILGPIGYFYAPSIALGILDLGASIGEFFWVSFATFLVQIAAAITLNLILLYRSDSRISTRT